MRIHYSYTFDPKLGTVVPVAMEESHEVGDSRTEGSATYVDFRRFGANVSMADAEPENPLDEPKLMSVGAEEYALRLDVPLVTVEAWASGPAGPELSLQREDFIVKESNIEQKITHFSPVNTPFDVLLLFDRSSSTRSKWPVMSQAAEGFLANLRTQDRLAVATFDARLRMLTRWTDGRERIRTAIKELAKGRPGGGTAFYDSVERTLTTELLPIAGRRRALVVLTDGRDNRFYSLVLSLQGIPQPETDPDFRRVLEVAAEEHVPIYIVAYNTDRNQEVEKSGLDEFVRLRNFYPGTSLARDFVHGVRVRLEHLAAASGGRILFPRRFQDVVPMFKHLSHDIGTTYSIGYTSSVPRNAAGFRQITVTARDPRVRLTQSRAGYTIR
jgi:VWFA-related protein